MPSEPDNTILEMAESELTKQWNADNERVAMRARDAKYRIEERETPAPFG